MNNTFITFIIPTIGRNSLKNSIKSLEDQSDNNWNAIIIFDGIDINIDNMNDKIKIIKIHKKGIIEKKNCAGFVRNYGMALAKNTEWIGFLDDDDYLAPNYIEKLREEIDLNNEMDICIFRMAYKNKCVLPSKYDKNIIRTKVGISFTLKKSVADQILFHNSPFEDFMYLKDAQNKKFKIVISSYVTYFIKTLPFETELYPKILINFSKTIK